MTSTEPTICVVLVPPGTAAPGDLRAALAERSYRMIECDEPETAMAELCLSERAERSRSAWGLEHAPAATLVVVDAHRRPEWDDLRNAVERYLPRVGVLAFTGGRLSEVRKPAPAVLPGDERQHEDRRADLPALGGRHDPADAVVTGDEIAMLLREPDP